MPQRCCATFRLICRRRGSRHHRLVRLRQNNAAALSELLETADTGSITVAGETLWSAADTKTQSEEAIRKKRLHFGLVFQSFNLFPQYTALQNVMLAGQLLAKERPDYKQNRRQILADIETQAKAPAGADGAF